MGEIVTREQRKHWAELAEESDFVILPAEVTFLTENPVEAENQWGRLCWRWSVILHNEFYEYHTILSVTSKRLLKKLATIRPLLGKRVYIGKKGNGYDTVYSVEVISEPSKPEQAEKPIF